MAITANVYVETEGCWLAFVMTNPGNTATAALTAVAGTLVVNVNGSPVAMGPPVYQNTTHAGCYVLYLFPVVILATDVITYTITAAAFTTASGTNAAVTMPANVPNYVGRDNPGFGGLPSFALGAPTMAMGVNCVFELFNDFYPLNPAKNARLRCRTPFTLGSGTSAVTYDSTDPTLVKSWTAGGIITSVFWSTVQDNQINANGMPAPAGQWSIVYPDANANNSNKAVIKIAGSTLTSVGTDTVSTAAPTAGVRSVNNATSPPTVTVKYQIDYASKPNTAHGYNLGLTLVISSPLGNSDSAVDFSQLWIFAPGDEDNTTSNPIAPSNYLLSVLTTPNGNGPSIIRSLDWTVGGGNQTNFQAITDLVSSTAFSWNLQAANLIPCTFVRFLNTNPAKDNVSGDSTYAWPASTKIYYPSAGVDGYRLGVSGTDGFGAYLDLNANGGATDNGKFMDAIGYLGNPDVWAALEFVTASPHGLRTGDTVTLQGFLPNVAEIIPITGFAAGGLMGGVTVSVANGSTAITFSTPVTLAANTCFLFGADTTGQAYRLAGNGGTGTVFALTGAYNGTNSLTSSVTTTAGAGLAANTGKVFVTGASSFGMVCGNTFSVTSGATVQTVASTAQIAYTASVFPTRKGEWANHEFLAGLCAKWANTSYWMHTNATMPIAVIQHITDLVCAQLRAGTRLIVELGDEPWNDFAGFTTGPTCGAYGKILKYVPASTATNAYYTTGAGTQLTIMQSYANIAAYHHDVITAQAATHNKGIIVERAFGGQGASSTPGQSVFDWCNAHSIPVGSYHIADYVDTPNTETSWITACETSGGNISCQAMHAWQVHYIKYGTIRQSYYAAQNGVIQSYAGPAAAGQVAGKPALRLYEAGVDIIGPLGNAQPTQNNLLQIDLGYHPAYPRTFNAAFQSMQTGDPSTPGSGAVSANNFSVGSERVPLPGNLWSTVLYHGQKFGNGLSNQFTTAQGGSPGDGGCYDVSFTGGTQTGNVSVEQPAWAAWIDAQAPTPSASQLFEQALAAKLLSITALAALVGTSIYTQALPQTHDLAVSGPALSYSIPTKPRGHVLTGSDGTATARVQLDAWSYNYGTSKLIVEAAWNAIDGPPGVWGDGTCIIMSVVQQDDIDASERPQAGSDQWLYHLIQEYNVKYRVTLPTLT